MEETVFGLQGQLWITAGDQSLGGHGRVRLLSRIAELGSISQAAKSMKMSYKAAWDAVNHMNNLAGEPLLHREVGGKGGGSTVLTARGVQLVANFQRIEECHQRFLQELSKEATNLTDDLFVLRGLTMKTSARNQFFGAVTAIETGAVNDLVSIGIPNGQTIVASITCDSRQELELHVGSEVFALIKAGSIILACPDAEVRYSARNQLEGTVSRIETGAVNSEVVLQVGESTLVAMVTNESVTRLQLTEGSLVVALFKAGSVIVGCAL